MKAGFWVAPDDAEAPISIIPVGLDEAPRAKTGTGTLAFLATADAEELIARCPRVAVMLPKVTSALETQLAKNSGLLFDLGDLNADEMALLESILGEGEVAATVALPDNVVASVQESVMAGLWRVRFADASGALLADYIEVASIPEVIKRASFMTKESFEIGVPPDGAMNVMPVLAEIRDRLAGWQPGMENHTIAFTLFPMTPEDMDYLQETLGNGPVKIVSRGYGNCRIQATAIHRVWSVQFYNSMDTILLDTLEIGNVPVVAQAAEEDFRDSAERLREIEEAYFK